MRRTPFICAADMESDVNGKEVVDFILAFTEVRARYMGMNGVGDAAMPPHGGRPDGRRRHQALLFSASRPPELVRP